MALEQRLLNLARETELSLARLRKTVVFDRLLARLSASAPDRWVLKGALALDFRFESAGRATKDIDLVRRDNEEAATEDVIAAQAAELDDHFVFTIEKVENGKSGRKEQRSDTERELSSPAGSSTRSSSISASPTPFNGSRSA